MSIEQTLNFISEKLNQGRASVMIGSGFSKNAETEHTSKQFPNWAQLGELLYEKLYPSVGIIGKDVKFINILKLAEEFEAVYGRSELDRFLLENIPDKEFEPSELHIKLLELPWNNVLTTNYDTLIERASSKVYSRKYDLVLNNLDLINKSVPRIIKLHGSFPSNMPFIFTEEDYRSYPEKFKPLINTVRQILIENILVLIGFSGDDPNFLQWIGWIRDNYGHNYASNLYLVGFEDINESKRKYLDSKKINYIKLEGLIDKIDKREENKYDECNDLHISKTELIQIFFSKLKGTKKDILEYHPFKSYSLTQDEDFKNQHENILLDLKQLRSEYPGWIIAPFQVRKRMQYLTSQLLNYLKNIDHLKITKEHEYALIFELVWRINIDFSGLTDINIKQINYVVSEINNELQNRNSSLLLKNLEKEGYDLKWIIDLNLKLLSLLREESKLDEWMTLNELLIKLKCHFNSDQENQLYYEAILFHLYYYDRGKAEQLIKKWEINSLIEKWAIIKAALLAEIEELKKAIDLTTQVINVVRGKSIRQTEKDNLKIKSVEGLALYQYEIIKDCFDLENGNYKRKTEENEPFSQSVTERLKELEKFGIDFAEELNNFENLLVGKQVPKVKNIKYNFDIGSYSVQSKLSNESNSNAYSYIKFLEQTGIPVKLINLNISVSTTKFAIMHLQNGWHLWSSTFAFRYQEKKFIDISLSRFSVSTLSKINLKSIYKKVFDYVETLVIHLQLNQEESITHLIDYLSRLATRLSDDENLKIYKLFLEIYNDRNVDFNLKLNIHIARISKCLFSNSEKLITTFFETVKPVKNYERIHSFNSTPLIEILNSCENPIIVPFAYLQTLIGYLGTEYHHWAIANLFVLDLNKKLSVEHIEKLNSAIRDLPKNVFLLPAVPLGFDFCINNLGIEFINEALSIRIEKQNYEPLVTTNSFSNNDVLKIDMFLLARVLEKRHIINLSLESIISQMLPLWEVDKIILDSKDSNDPFSHLVNKKEILLDRFNFFSTALAHAVVNNQIHNSQFEQLLKFADSLINKGVAAYKLKAATSVKIYSNLEIKYLQEQLINKLLVVDTNHVFNLIEAVKILLKRTKIKEGIRQFINMLFIRLNTFDVFDLAQCTTSFIELLEWRLTDIKAQFHYSNIILERIRTKILDSKYDEFNFEEKLIFKKQGVRLAASLMKYSAEFDTDLEKEIKHWESIAFDENEFNDIKIEWLKNISS